MPELGDGPIQPEYYAQMNAVAKGLDEIFNGDKKGEARTTGFVLLVFPFNDTDGGCNYISNATREDVVVMLKEQLARFQGQPEMKGRA
jgi:hypothetical protein